MPRLKNIKPSKNFEYDSESTRLAQSAFLEEAYWRARGAPVDMPSPGWSVDLPDEDKKNVELLNKMLRDLLGPKNGQSQTPPRR